MSGECERSMRKYPMGSPAKHNSRNNRLLTVIIGLAVLAACLLVSRTLSFQLPSVQAYQVSPSEVNFITAGEFERVRRARVNEVLQPFTSQWQRQQRSPRQFNYMFELNPKQSQNELALYLPSIGGTASVYINGMGISNSTSRKFSAPGFGRQAFFTKLPSAALQPGRNRINIIVNEGRKSGLKHFYFGPHSALERSFLNHQNRVKVHNSALCLGDMIALLLTAKAALLLRGRE